MSALYRVLLASMATPGRIVGLGLLGLVSVVLGFLLRSSGDPATAGTVLVAELGLSLIVPVTTLVFATSALGDPDEDGTLVYLWLRPVARWRIVAAATAATLTVAAPLSVGPLALAAGLVGAGPGLVAGTVAAGLLATVAYTGLFTWLGLRAGRALVWGAMYILVWEGFVARAGDTPARLAVRSYTQTLLTELADGPRGLAEVGTTAAVVVPLLAGAAAVALTVRRLARQDVR